MIAGLRADYLEGQLDLGSRLAMGINEVIEYPDPWEDLKIRSPI